VVPLVFKTSLGAVRFPEGSTPSLLRQISLTPHRGSSANAFRSLIANLRNCPVKLRMPIADPKRPTAESSHYLIS
jgi:hypothetical protein